MTSEPLMVNSYCIPTRIAQTHHWWFETDLDNGTSGKEKRIYRVMPVSAWCVLCITHLRMALYSRLWRSTLKSLLYEVHSYLVLYSWIAVVFAVFNAIKLSPYARTSSPHLKLNFTQEYLETEYNKYTTLCYMWYHFVLSNQIPSCMPFSKIGCHSPFVLIFSIFSITNSITRVVAFYLPLNICGGKFHCKFYIPNLQWRATEDMWNGLQVVSK